MKGKGIVARLMMIGGALIYLLDIWLSCPQLSDKGYFLAALVMGMFAVLTHRRATGDSDFGDDGFVSLCRLVLLLALGLLLVGVRNAAIGWGEKGVFVAAWFICLYGVAIFPWRTVRLVRYRLFK